MKKDSASNGAYYCSRHYHKILRCYQGNGVMFVKNRSENNTDESNESVLQQ